MFERFTESARQVVIIAQGEARALGHHYIGSEHILLGLIEGGGIASRVLAERGIEKDAAIAKLTPGDEKVMGQLPFTPRSKKLMEVALREALSLGHNYIGTEHLLLGLMRDPGTASVILGDLTYDEIRGDLAKELSNLWRDYSNPSWRGSNPSWRGGPTGATGVAMPLVEYVRRAKDAALDAGNHELAAELRKIERRL